MDPILDLSSLGKRAQIRDAAWVALMTILGGPADLEDFYAIPKEMLLAGLQAFEFKPDADQPGEKLTLVQIGRLSQCYDTRPSAKPDPVSSLAKTTHDAAVQLKHVVNESMEGFVKRPDSDDMTKLLLIYQSRCGGLPRDEIEPTPDQIGALRQILDSGAPPLSRHVHLGPTPEARDQEVTTFSHAVRPDDLPLGPALLARASKLRRMAQMLERFQGCHDHARASLHGLSRLV